MHLRIAVAICIVVLGLLTPTAVPFANRVSNSHPDLRSITNIPNDQKSAEAHMFAATDAMTWLVGLSST